MDAETQREILKSCPSLGEAVNKAAQYLPEGWIVRIHVEKDGYGVYLVNYKQGVKVDIDGDGVVGCVNDAIAHANGLDS